MFYRTFRSVRCRYRCCTDTGTNSGTDVHTGTGGTGIDVPNLPKCLVPVWISLPKCLVPVWISYRTYRSVRYRYESLYRYRRYRYPCRAELTEVSGTGIDVVPNIPKCPVPVLMSYQTYRVSGTGNTGDMYRRYASVRTVPNTPLDLFSGLGEKRRTPRATSRPVDHGST